MRSVTDVSAVTRERHSRERSTPGCIAAAMAAWLHWLHDRLSRGGGSISKERPSTRAPAADQRQARDCLAIRRTSGGRGPGGPSTAGCPAGQRRAALPPPDSEFNFKLKFRDKRSESLTDSELGRAAGAAGRDLKTSR